MRTIIIPLLSFCLFATAPSAFALRGELNRPGVAFSSEFPKPNVQRVMKALNREDGQFLGGNFINSFTTLRYGGDTKALNSFLDDLAHCPGVVLSVSFVKNLGHDGDWHVHHEADRNRFHVRVSLQSRQIVLEEIVIPEIAGVDPADKAGEMVMLGYQEFDQKPGRGWRALADHERFVEAAAVIERYLKGHGGLTASEQANLHFHAAQCLALEGSDAHLPRVFEHLKNARLATEPSGSAVKWNDYVDATEAFLRKDLDALKAARDRIAAGPKVEGAVPNLDVVERLAAQFGKSYGEAYRAKGDKR